MSPRDLDTYKSQSSKDDMIDEQFLSHRIGCQGSRSERGLFRYAESRSSSHVRSHRKVPPASVKEATGCKRIGQILQVSQLHLPSSPFVVYLPQKSRQLRHSFLIQLQRHGPVPRRLQHSTSIVLSFMSDLCEGVRETTNTITTSEALRLGSVLRESCSDLVHVSRNVPWALVCRSSKERSIVLSDLRT